MHVLAWLQVYLSGLPGEGKAVTACGAAKLLIDDKSSGFKQVGREGGEAGDLHVSP